MLIYCYVNMSILFHSLYFAVLFFSYFLCATLATKCPYSFVWCLTPAGRNLVTFWSQVKISEVAEGGEMLTLCLTDWSKIAVTFEPIMQFGRPLIIRIYKKYVRWSILWLKAPSLSRWAWQRRKDIFTKNQFVSWALLGFVIESLTVPNRCAWGSLGALHGYMGGLPEDHWGTTQ